jgi:acyl-CoA thioesterase-1
MTKLALILLFLMPLLSTKPGLADTAPDAALTKFFNSFKTGDQQTVVAYGTSLTKYGYWVTAMQQWFAAEYPRQAAVVNSSGPGQGSDWGAARVKGQVLVHNPDLVLIEFGYNDAHTRKKISVDDAKANLDKIVSAIREQNASTAVVLQTMNVPWDCLTGSKTAATDRPQLAAYYENYRSYAAEHHLPLADHYAASLELQKTIRKNCTR